MGLSLFEYSDKNEPILLADFDSELMLEKEKVWLCRACQHIITKPESAMEINGTHYHTFQNPHSMVYHIGCFSDAEGCIAIGSANLEYTWFPGYAWKVALCRHCNQHLGWRFSAESEHFWGLILNNLLLLEDD